MDTIYRQRDQEREQWVAESVRLLRLSPEEAAREINKYCRFCGALLIPYVWEGIVFGKPRRSLLWRDKHGCPEEARALAAADVQAEIDAIVREREEYQHRLSRAGLVGWMSGATLETFTRRDDYPGVTDCRNRVAAYRDALLDRVFPIGGKNWLILYGGYGTGKSHLAAGVVRAALDAGWANVYFRVWTDYLNRLQASWKNNTADSDPDKETEEDIINEIQAGELVVIDDLDKRQPTTWTRSTLFSALNHRYNAQLPTVLTFNYGPDDADPAAPGRLALEAYLGAAVLDRIIGSAFDVIEFYGPSFRSKENWKLGNTETQRVMR